MKAKRDATIAANQQALLPDPAAITIVRFTTASVRSVQQTPYGWGPSVTTAYAEVKALYGTHPRLSAIFTLLDILLGGVLP